MPEISVVMPIYNGENYLPEAIESILGQTFRDFEFLIICEYGSNQKSMEIIEHYAKWDRRIRPIYNDKKLGISASLNVGLKEASGKYIARMDGDDISGRRRFEVQKLFLDTYQDIGVLGTSHTVINSPNWLISYVADPFLLESQLIFFASPVKHPTIMIRKELTERLQYDEALVGVEDYDFYDRLSRITKISNVLDPELFSYRRTGENASAIHKERDELIWKEIQKRILKERLQLEFNTSQITMLHLLSVKSYEKRISSGYANNMLELEGLLQQIEEKNMELHVYERDRLRQTLSHRWYREKYKLDILLNKTIPKDVMEVWKGSKYYNPWF